VSRPIIALTQATTSITKGDFNVSVENWGKDEIGELTRNFNTMVPQLKERLELRESLEVAKQIQQCLLPTSDPTFSGWEITGKSMYCDATGGDYYDFISPIDDDSHLRLALGDVTGHGIASALMMATARSLLRGGVRSGDDPVERLNHVNNSLVNDTPLGWFMTFFCLELQANSGEVHWVSAGHDPAIVVDLDGTVSELEGEDIPLGVTANWSFTGKGPTIIKPDAVIVLGTDGIWEARNEEGEMYDKPRMIEVILNHRTKPVAVICDAVTQAVLEFCGTAPRRDDITMLVARRVCDGSDPQSLS
jgi:sigma-B regulation protein RsbU (phosphoserine phosphatase)